MPTSVDAVIEAGLDGRTQATEFLSAHTAYSATGANEVSGGLYGRTALEWDAATGNAAANTNAETINIPASTTVRYLGRWSASTAGTFYGMVPNGSTHGEVAVALATGDIFNSAAHGFSDNDTVVVHSVSGAVPTGITEGTVYYVISATTDTFQLSATQGGAAVTITGSAPCIVYDIIEETFSGAGQIVVGAGVFVITGAN